MPLLLGSILVALLQFLVAAIAPASCSGSGDREYYVYSFPSFKGPQFYSGDREYYVSFPSFKGPQFYSGALKFSWDAGILDGVLHLTADDVYQPPVQYPPDAKRSAGHAGLTFCNKFFTGRLVDYCGPLLQEVSFNTTFTMSVSRSRAVDGDDGGLLFEVVPPEYRSSGLDRAIYSPVASTNSGNIFVEIGELEYYYDQGSFAAYVSISPAPAQNVTPPPKHTVWIDYAADRNNLSVYIADEGEAKPVQATLHAALNISAMAHTSSYYFGFFASKNRLLPSCQPVVYSWNLTVTTPSFTGVDRRRHIGFYIVRVIPAVLAVAAVAMAFAVVCCCMASRYKALAMKLKLSKAMRRLPGIPREFRYADVKKATRSFHESMKLGRGGFGAVYKGAMIASCEADDGRRRLQYVEVAVKKFTRKEERGYDDFLAEVAVINRLRHKNIVPLLGWCYENGELLLIYQYMINGSLDQHLFGAGDNHLQWETRYNVITDVAGGLHYVHHEYDHVVLHRDIKPSNIMLDAAFHGRLGDFGLARVVAFDKNSFTDLGVAGTWGFIAPEYAVSHKATRRTDVYAFGVLILEVVTGRRSLAAADSTFPLLINWVWWLHGEGRLLEAVADGEFSADDDDATRLLLLGLACGNPNPAHRPTMAEVVQVIARSMPPPDVPLTMPAFVWPPEGDASEDDDDDDFVQTDHRDSDRSHWEGSPERRHDGLATSHRSSEITKRNVVQTNITRDIENGV